MSPGEQAAFNALVDVLAFFQDRVKHPPVANCKRSNITKSRGSKQ